MQVIFEDEDKRGSSRGTSSMDSVICTERISRCMEGEYTGRFGNRRSKSAGEFLAGLKREFGGGDEVVVKVAELRKLEQRERTMEEFV